MTTLEDVKNATIVITWMPELYVGYRVAGVSFPDVTAFSNLEDAEKFVVGTLKGEFLGKMDNPRKLARTWFYGVKA